MTEKTCSQCGASRPLALFRRWRGRKRSVHSVCNLCKPEKKLSAMTPKERINASAAGRPGAHILVVLQRNQREADHLRYSVRPQQVLSRHREKRRVAWREALGKRLFKEQDWVDGALASARAAHAAGLPEGHAWAEFFSAYREVLVDLRQRIAVKHLEPGPVRLRMGDADPASHVSRSTLLRLRLLYGACRPIPNRRMYRDPWCLVWGQDDPIDRAIPAHTAR